MSRAEAGLNVTLDIEFELLAEVVQQQSQTANCSTCAHLLQPFTLCPELEASLGIALHVNLELALELLAEVVKQELINVTATQVTVPGMAADSKPLLLE